MTYFFETYGCQMNIAESAAAEQIFIAHGWSKADCAEKADIAIINTCSVRQTAENRIFGRLGWYAGLKAVRGGKKDAKAKSLPVAAEYVKDGAKPLTLVVMGCMAERLLKSMKRDYPVVDYCVGTYAKQRFHDIIADVENRRKPGELKADLAYTFSPLSLEQGAFTSFVPIMNGCNNFCTYCIVPYVRGREISRSVSEIFAELDALSAKGVREITLLGQNVNSYRGLFDRPLPSTEKTDEELITFPRLMSLIASHLEETASPIGWVRFESSHPKDLSEELLDVIAKNPRLCRHIHLPVQHGSSRILKAMNRRYTREDYLCLAAKIREKLPDASLTTDIMIGFPDESEEDFEEVISLMKEVRYESAFMYYYNPREGTPAASMQNQIDMAEKKRRLQRVIDTQLAITTEEMQRRVGRTVKVLAESVSRDSRAELLGKTEQDERVAFAASEDKIGQFVTVHLDSLNGNTFKGTMQK